MEPLIPADARETIRAHYLASILDNRDVYKALETRGELYTLGEVARVYAEQMLAEVETLARKYDVASEVRQERDWWGAWRFCIPQAVHSEPGKAWLPSRGLTLSPLPEQPKPERKVGFHNAPPMMSPAPMIAAGLSAEEVQGIVAAAVSAALSRPRESTSEIEQVDAAGKTTKQVIRVKHHSP